MWPGSPRRTDPQRAGLLASRRATGPTGSRRFGGSRLATRGVLSAGVPALSNIFDPRPTPATPTATPAAPSLSPVLSPSAAPAEGAPARASPRQNRQIRVYRPTPDEWRPALALALAGEARSASQSAVTGFLHQPAFYAAAVAGLTCVTVRDKPRFAMVPLPSPGKTALLLTSTRLPRRAIEGLDAAIAAAIRHACQSQKANGIHLAQILLPSAATKLAGILTERCGFWPLADLLYLQKRCRRRGNGPIALPAGWRTEPYSAATHDWFRVAVARSYESSLDCPELSGRREIEDVIAGHKAAGEFRPSLWRVLLREDGGGHVTPAGVLLLSGLGVAGTAGVELVYLGLTPEARGRGFGERLLSVAQAAAAATHGGTLALAVDARNTPALRLYRQGGLRQVQTRQAFLRDLRDAD